MATVAQPSRNRVLSDAWDALYGKPKVPTAEVHKPAAKVPAKAAAVHKKPAKTHKPAAKKAKRGGRK